MISKSSPRHAADVVEAQAHAVAGAAIREALVARVGAVAMATAVARHKGLVCHCKGGGSYFMR